MSHPARHRIGLALLMAAASLGAYAAGDDIDSGRLTDRDRPNMEERTGFVVSRTATNFGAEFFREFSDAWRDIDGTGSFDVTVVERPSARFGSQIFIEHNNRQIARVFLYAGRTAAIRPLATEAAAYVAKVLSDDALIGALTVDPDLAKDELR
jgi:curli production assembly/transport component CsgE